MNVDSINSYCGYYGASKALSMRRKKTSELEKDRTFQTLFSIFPQKGRKSPKLGLAVVLACAKKSSEGTPKKYQT
jgi:hypothetical protein